MKKYFSLLYWPVMVVVMACILSSLMGSFGHGLLLSLALMPGVLFVKYFSKDLSFENRRKGITNFVYFVLIVLLIEYLCIVLVYSNLYGMNWPDGLPSNMPGIMRNPLFVLFLVGAVIAIEKLILSKLPQPESPGEKFVTFTSERSRISLASANILYIESRDYEVLVVTVQGSSHPTRMKISQWEAVLDERFVRIHRAFIVNRDHVLAFDSKAVNMDTGQSLEISRKYRDTAPARLSK